MKRLFIFALVCVALIPVRARAQWTANGNPISTAQSHQYGPQSISDGAGGAIIVWRDARFGPHDIYAQRINALGVPQWTPDGVAVCTEPGVQDTPCLVSDGAGGAFIVWQDLRSGDYDVYARRVDASGNVLWKADGVAVAVAADNQVNPMCISDGAGGAIITWRDQRNGGVMDIYAQRLDGNGKEWWAANGVVVCNAPNDQWDPIPVEDGFGGAIITWSDHRSGFDFDVYAQRIDNDGKKSWTSTGVPVCTASGYQFYPMIVSDGASGGIITWQDERITLTPAAYAQRISASGVNQWTANGVAVCTATGLQTMPKIISDAAGGAIVVWQDYRTGEYDLYAQRFNATGVRQWTSTGIPLCTAPGNQWSVPFVSDGAGGAIVTWPDLRTGTYDVYAQHVTASGGVTWTINGAGLCTAAGPQSVPSIAPNGSGGAIVSWTDERDGNRDIYGQRVSANGEWGYPEPSITSVVDVPGDQGRHVRVRWNEGDKGASQSYYYEVYRNTGGTWSYVGAVGDNGGASYNLAVETLDDSTCWVPFSHQFQVRAWGAFLTPDISNTVLGRSVDNLVPPAPVLTEQHVGGTVTLDWTPSPAADLNNYSVYLSSVPGQLGTVFDTVYDATYTIEFAPPYPDQYWSVAAWDVHCNRGAPSNQVALLFPNTLVGTNVSVAPWDDGGTATHPAYLEFSNVTTEGRTSLNITSTGPSLPGSFSAGDGKYYNLTTTATTTGNIQVCIQYNESALSVPEANLRLLHYDSVLVPPAWVDITNYLDTVNNVVCGLTDHLSPFVIGAGSVTAVGDGRALRCALYDAVPNPFNPQTTIRYDVVAGGAHVNISIFDVAGRRVRELVDERRAAGTWSVQWNGADDRGQRVASGVYFYRMRADEFVETKKMVLLK